MKAFAKKTLAAFGLLKLMQQLNYRRSFLSKGNRHPRKLVYQFYSQFMKKGQLVFDIGANVGERVAVFDELGAITVAVEPQVHCVDKIRERFGGNKNVRIENIGLADKKGEMDFYICDSDDRLSTFSNDQMENSFFSSGTHWNRKEVIAVLTLDDLIEQYGMPVFCKIDVEGFELNVLKGLHKPVPSLSFEFSSKQPDKIGACLTLLGKVSADYKFNVCFGEPYGLHFDHWVEANEILEEVGKQDKLFSTHAWGDIYAKLTH